MTDEAMPIAMQRLLDALKIETPRDDRVKETE